MLNTRIDNILFELLAIVFGSVFYISSYVVTEHHYPWPLIWASPFILWLFYLIVLRMMRMYFPESAEVLSKSAIILFYISLSIASVGCLILDPWSLPWALIFLIAVWVPTYWLIKGEVIMFRVQDMELLDGVKDEGELIEIALKDSDKYRRLFSVMRLKNKAVLETVVREDADDEVKDAARLEIAAIEMSKVEDQSSLEKIAKDAEEIYIKCAAIRYITNVEFLREISLETDSTEVKEAAKERFIKMLDILHSDPSKQGELARLREHLE